jgi:hypothetical protein
MRNLPSARSRLCLTLAALLLGATVAQGQPDQSMARLVPEDVGLFIELRSAADLLTPLVEPQIWVALADLAGQPAQVTETDAWRRQVRQTVNMDPIQAIQRLFSRRVAFVAEGLRQTQDAVIICQPVGNRRELIRTWPAKPLPASGRASVYRLPGNVGLAAHGELFMFGDYVNRGLFDRIIQQVDEGKQRSLADNPIYQRLLSQVPPDPDGVFFARLTPRPPASGPAQTQPGQASGLPLPHLLRDSSHILLALHRDKRLLHFTAAGDAPRSTPPRDGSLRQLAGALPEQTLLAWSGHVDYARLLQMAGSLPERNLIRVIHDLQARAGTLTRLSAVLESSACVAVGAVTPTRREVPAPPLPAAAVLLKCRDAEVAEREWRALFHSTVAIYKLLSLKMATPPRLAPIETIEIEGTPAECLDLSTLISRTPEKTPLAELHLCWARDGDTLIIASHRQWLEKILAARRGGAARLAAVMQSRRFRAGRFRTWAASG